MAEDYAMLEVTSVGVAEEEAEIELSLELSIGRNYNKAEKPKSKEQNLPNANNDGMALDSQQQQQQQQRSWTRSEGLSIVNPGDAPEQGMDSKRKREIHAMRRQEARKKREEKLKKTLCRRGINIGIPSAGNGFTEAEAQQNMVRDRDREMGENVEVLVDSVCKKERKNDQQCVSISSNVKEDLNLALSQAGAGLVNLLNPVGHCGSSSSSNLPASVQFGYSPYQFVPFSNRLVYSGAMPCWASPPLGNAGTQENEKRNVIQPVACRSFRPYQGNRIGGNNLSIARDSDHKDSRTGKISKLLLNGSLERSSSAVSDYQSTSQHGSSSSEAGSHSSHSQQEYQCQQHWEQSVSFNKIEQDQATVDKADNGLLNKTSSDIPRSNQLKSVGRQSATSPQPQVDQPRSMTKSDLVMKPTAPTETVGMYKLQEAEKQKNGIPSQKPENQKIGVPSLLQMPCVSTTGNGPNGKTITGFLYRYTKTEVSIVCVCHGSSFSPAEFVEHAGGIDISHPLRHITVIPSAFG